MDIWVVGQPEMLTKRKEAGALWQICITTKSLTDVFPERSRFFNFLHWARTCNQEKGNLVVFFNYFFKGFIVALVIAAVILSLYLSFEEERLSSRRSVQP